MIHYDEPLYRPPSEARSLILQATIGCSHNRCAFCVNYRSKRFRVKKQSELFAEIEWAGANLPHVRRVFLADGDALVLSVSKLERILNKLRAELPDLERVTAYAGPKNFRNKTTLELSRLKQAGLQMLYIGAESGDDEVLCRIDKGVTAQEMIELCRKPQEAGIDLSITVILGLGGPRLSKKHARNTAALLDAISPRYASALTLMLAPRSPSFAQAFGDPAWRMLEPAEILAECREMIAAMHADGITFRSNHASNYLALAGELSRDKDALLGQIDEALRGEGRLRPEFLRGL